MYWMSSFPARIENEGTRVVTRFSPIISLWELSVGLEESGWMSGGGGGGQGGRERRIEVFYENS